MRVFTIEEVSKHNSKSDCWVIIRDLVYDLSKFIEVHPGGSRIILTVAGKDATKAFELHHNTVSVLHQYKRLFIGTISSDYVEVVEGQDEYGVDCYGDRVAFADPAWYQGWVSPYYNDSHRRLRKWARQIVDEKLLPFVFQWEKNGRVPTTLYKEMAQLNLIPAVTGLPRWPSEEFVKQEPPCGIQRAEWDALHSLIMGDELSRVASAGVSAALTLGPSIALPPIMKFAADNLKQKVIGPVLNGDKTIALAITEPYAGSDVANIQTTATLDSEGQHYILNGEKKWITNGVWADFFVVAARTGSSGMAGITLFLVERSMGVETRPVNCQGNICSGTAFVIFDAVRVPKSNIVGKLNKGFKCIMANFNSERLGICVSTLRSARICYEVAMKYANKRRTFGQTLFSRKPSLFLIHKAFIQSLCLTIHCNS